MKKPTKKHESIFRFGEPIPESLAKTVLQNDGNRVRGISVKEHCRIVGETARELIARKPDWLRKALFPVGSELVAAVHDVGKLSPGFQEKIHQSLGISLGLGIPADLDDVIGGHAAVSQASLSGKPCFIAEIAGRHHGYSPMQVGFPDEERYGGTAWQKERFSLVESLRVDFEADWPKIESVEQADLLAGLVTVADWIGSGSLFNRLTDEWIADVRTALDQAGFISPKIRTGLAFEEIFHCFPYPLQQQFYDSVLEPGIYVLEAPMGFGKTEAALYAAYRILAKDRATGIYFALPTQLTSNKIQDRMAKFLDAILESDSPGRHSLLLHGSAWLQETELGEEGQPGRAWFDGNKRGLLAPFAVGTLDQALMAVMNIKHGFVRTFGLTGKVVILDEVHSYDSYTGSLLDHLVSALEKLHCTVIILSATLTGDRKNALLSRKDPEKNALGENAYPLVSAKPRNGKLSCLRSEEGEKKTIAIRMLSDDRIAQEEVLCRAEAGQQVLWIENTVEEAQIRYELLSGRAAEMKIPCGLIHSRFLKSDRAKKEDLWVDLYGKNGREQRRESGRILVGTQVLEQSLDIDADFLITRLAPTDMLFQRMGRLWRHRNNDPIRPAHVCREAWILAPSLLEAQQNRSALGKSANVYAPYVLCRSLALWQGLSFVDLPGQIRSLLDTTYRVQFEETENMNRYRQEMEEKRDALRRLALIGTARGGKTLPESKASTRYSEMESSSVLLLRSRRLYKEGTRIQFLDGRDVDLPRNPKSISAFEWRKKAASLYNNMVPVPAYLAPETSCHQLKCLEGYMFLGNKEETPFQVALVDTDGSLWGLDSSPEPRVNYHLEYNDTIGYRARKKSTFK